MNRQQMEDAMQQHEAQQYGYQSYQSVMHGGDNHGGVVISETTRPLSSANAINAGLPVLVSHSSSLVAPQPAGHLIPTNVRPPQCLAAAAVGSAYIPSALTGSPFFHAAPSAPPCISRNPQAPTLAALTHRLGAPIFSQRAADVRNYSGMNQHHQQGMNQMGGEYMENSNASNAQMEAVSWPPPGSVSVGYGNPRSAMDASGSAFTGNHCVMPTNTSKGLAVISVPNQQAGLYNKVAEDMTRSLKAMGCFTVSNPMAASLSKHLVASTNRQHSKQKRKESELAASLAAAAAAEEEVNERERLARETEAKAAEEAEARKKLQEMDASQLLCLSGPSPAQIRQQREAEAAMWRQQQEQQMQQQLLQEQQQAMIGGEHMQHSMVDMWSNTEEQYCRAEYPAGEMLQQVDRDYLREQIMLQEQRISQLHQQLMEHQHSREQKRQASPAAARHVECTESSYVKGKTADPHKYATDAANSMALRHSSSSTKGSSRQSSDQDRTKSTSVDNMLAQYLVTNGLDPSLFRRVRSGVYFYGRTKLLMKLQRGQLSCMALHLTQEQQQKQQQRFVAIDRFLREQGALNKPCSC